MARAARATPGSCRTGAGRPSFAEQGEEGEERWLRLELKLMADVALVGFPNVGKSTLISRISAAKPKIADYPFTTLEPNLGVVRTDDGDEFVVADIPGLIEGASEGKGLGHQFLRHIERARVLALLIDLADRLGARPRRPSSSASCSHELGRYRPELLDRPRIVIGSRADLADEAELRSVADAVEAATASRRRRRGRRPTATTSTSSSRRSPAPGLPRAIGLMADAVRHVRAEEPEPEAFIVYRPVAEGIRVERADDGGFEVRRPPGPAGRRPVRPHQPRGARLRPRPPAQARRRPGPGPGRGPEGDLVRIGKLTFEYDEDGI